MNSSTKIVMFSVSLPDGATLELAEDADGSIVLLRDGTMLPGSRWAAGEVEKGVVAFRKYRRTYQEPAKAGAAA